MAISYKDVSGMTAEGISGPLNAGLDNATNLALHADRIKAAQAQLQDKIQETENHKSQNLMSLMSNYAGLADPYRKAAKDRFLKQAAQYGGDASLNDFMAAVDGDKDFARNANAYIKNMQAQGLPIDWKKLSTMQIQDFHDLGANSEAMKATSDYAHNNAVVEAAQLRANATASIANTRNANAQDRINLAAQSKYISATKDAKNQLDKANTISDLLDGIKRGDVIAGQTVSNEINAGLNALATGKGATVFGQTHGLSPTAQSNAAKVVEFLTGKTQQRPTDDQLDQLKKDLEVLRHSATIRHKRAVDPLIAGATNPAIKGAYQKMFNADVNNYYGGKQNVDPRVQQALAEGHTQEEIDAFLKQRGK
jgi:hypothetical protein